MFSVIERLWLWLWHLLPGNPILVRVVHGASRRTRHLWLRVGYLSALLAVVFTILVASTQGRSGSLAELAKGASQTFMWASMTQLALMCFLAPVFTAGAITQERDAKTFNILLSTPLSSAQIVFGSLLSRLYFVMTLLLAGLPIFLITMTYGGVTTGQILESFALAGATAVLTGALAIFVAMLRVGTRGTILTFYLAIATYLLSLYFLAQWGATWLEDSPPNLSGAKMSWLTPLHPFLALDVALNRVHPPPFGRLVGVWGPIRYALAYPSSAYVTWTTLLALFLTSASIFFVRGNAFLGDETYFGRFLGMVHGRPRGERTRQPRRVWANPIAWREAKTRASGGGSFIRWTLIIGGAAAALLLFVEHFRESLSADEARIWLAGLVTFQFAIALIIATNTAATSMTKERELKTMDLLLTTPLTSRAILLGKLRGLVSSAAPLLLGPVAVLMIFALFAKAATDEAPPVWFETPLQIGLLMLVYTACVCVIGLHISLNSKSNVSAVMYSIGLIIILCGVSWLLGNGLVSASQEGIGAVLAPLTPFTSMWYLVNPRGLFDSAAQLAQNAPVVRIGAAFGTVVAIGAYAFIVWAVFRGLVKNFDMIIRRQTGT